MPSVEFDADVSNGVIQIPDSYRDYFHGTVRVVVFGADDAHDVSWAAKNTRRWELIAKNLLGSLTDEETQELAQLQQLAETELARVGPRPLTELQHLEAELSQRD